MAKSVVHEGLYGRISGSRGSMWPSQCFMRVYVAESEVHEGLCGRVSGSCGFI